MTAAPLTQTVIAATLHVLALACRMVRQEPVAPPVVDGDGRVVQ